MIFLHHAVHCAMFRFNANYRFLWLWGLSLSGRSWKFFFALWWFCQVGSILLKLKWPLLKLSHKSKCRWRVFLHISVVVIFLLNYAFFLSLVIMCFSLCSPIQWSQFIPTQLPSATCSACTCVVLQPASRNTWSWRGNYRLWASAQSSTIGTIIT